MSDDGMNLAIRVSDLPGHTQDELIRRLAERDAMRPVVESACEYVDTVHRYDVEQSRRVGRGSRAGIRRAVSAYRAQQDATNSTYKLESTTQREATNE